MYNLKNIYQNEDFLTRFISFVSKHKKAFFSLLFFLLFLIIYGSFLNQRQKNEKFFLSIKANPPTAKIYINNNYQGVGSTKASLVRGQYDVLVSEQGYLDTKQTVDLTKNIELEISLQSIQDVNKEIVSIPISIDEGKYVGITQISSTSFLAIDPQERSLVKVENDNTIKVLYPRNVDSYQIGKEYAVVLEKEDTNDFISLVNIKTGIIKRLKNSEVLTPISSVSISADDKDLYIIGNYTLQTRMSLLYKSSANDFNPSQLLITDSHQVFSLKDSTIALVIIGESLDDGEIKIINPENKQVLFETKQNNFSISPEKDKICVTSSKSIFIYNTTTKQAQEIKIANKDAFPVWKDNNTIIFFQNSNNGAEYFYIDTRSNKNSPIVRVADLNNNGIAFIQGIINNTVYVIDLEGKTRKIIVE